MALPDLIEIVPLAHSVSAAVTVPGSKSITNRALILAALAEGEVTLEGALWSEDTQVMTEALQTLGFEIRVELDAEEFCNRRIMVKGQGGRLPRAGTAEKPLELFVGNAGTAARFLTAMLCLGDGVYRLSGVPRMHERPQAALFKALRELGYRVDSPNDKLPVTIFGDARARSNKENKSLLTSAATVSIAESSQFASALLLSARQGSWHITVEGEDAEEAPYVTMTERLVEAFPQKGGTFQIEPDASSGSYFWAANTLLNQFTVPARGQKVEVLHWPETGWQMDARFRDYSLHEIAARHEVSRASDLADSIMTAIVMAPLEPKPKRFTELGRLRVQECERVVALRTELGKCGAQVVETGDMLTVTPSSLHGAEIATYNDHRMAMCFAILGLKVPGIRIHTPACVKKTFPNFFQKLAAPVPHGLGAVILDGHTSARLDMKDLFAD